MRFGVVRIEELHDMKAASIHIEMDIALFKIGCAGLPDINFRMHCLDCQPRRIAKPLAVDLRVHEQQLQIAAAGFAVNAQDNAAGVLPVVLNAIGLRMPAVNSGFDGLTGDDLAVLLKVIITQSELLHSAVQEGSLVIRDELLTVRRLQRDKINRGYAFHNRHLLSGF